MIHHNHAPRRGYVSEYNRNRHKQQMRAAQALNLKLLRGGQPAHLLQRGDLIGNSGEHLPEKQQISHQDRRYHSVYYEQSQSRRKKAAHSMPGIGKRRLVMKHRPVGIVKHTHGAQPARKQGRQRQCSRRNPLYVKYSRGSHSGGENRCYNEKRNK